MKSFKLIIGVLAAICGTFAMAYVLNSEHALVTHPKGIISESQLELMIKNFLLMLAIVIPTFILLFYTVWRQRKETKHTPDKVGGVFGELMLWIAPLIIVLIMAPITWFAAHELDPYRPLSDEKPMTIQVIAIDWKWLFIYPEQGIATLNYFQFPENKPIRFELAADSSPMNSFWIPQLSGQIYSMTGMTTQLHILAHEPGIYTGRAAEINGEGYADMTFIAEASLMPDFEKWVSSVKQSPLKLTQEMYKELVKPSINDPIALYSSVDNDFFTKIVMKYMHHNHQSTPQE